MFDSENKVRELAVDGRETIRPELGLFFRENRDNVRNHLDKIESIQHH